MQKKIQIEGFDSLATCIFFIYKTTAKSPAAESDGSVMQANFYNLQFSWQISGFMLIIPDTVAEMF